MRRKLKDADIYFVANTSNHPVKATARFGSRRPVATWIDTDSGKLTRASSNPALDLAPYESRVLVFSDAPLAGTAEVPARSAPALLADLSTDWTIAFPGAQPQPMRQLRSWAEDERTRYFSGEAVYTKVVTLDAAQLQGRRVLLDFGPGTPLASTPKVPAGMRAMLESPVREAAQVLVNGKLAGAVWRPPYTVDVTPYLAAGSNRIEVRVANLGLNARAGQALPDYRLLNVRYGERFKPQDTELVKPMPSGMLGPVRLMAEKSL